MNFTSRAALIGSALVGAVLLGVTIVPADANAHSLASGGLTDEQRQQIVSRFASAIVHDDHQEIVASTTPNMTWTIPGTSVVSGRFVGQKAVLELADTFARYNLTISVRALAFGVDTVAVELHDTGNHNGKALDQDVVNVLTIGDGKIASLSGNLADVDAFDAYFSVTTTGQAEPATDRTDVEFPVAGAPRVPIHQFYLQVESKFSADAVSYASPTEPVDRRIPLPTKRCAKHM